MHPIPISPEELNQILSEKFQKRFWSKIKIGNQDECWPWQASIGRCGYGHVGAAGKVMNAHRVAWVIQNQCDVPEGKDILHSCIMSRTCCNPNHLRPGTDTENQIDSIIQGTKSTPQGSKHGNAKLTEEDVKKIRELYATGNYRYLDICKMFTIGQAMVGHIVTRRKWTHI